MWLYLVLLATAFWAVQNICDKILIEHYVKHSSTIVMAFGLGGLLASVIFLLAGFSYSFSFEGGLMFFAGMLFPISSYTFYRAIRVEEASRVIPLIFLKPLFVLIIATFLFQEVFTFPTYVGIVAVVLGAMLISLKRDNGKIHETRALKFIMVSVIIWGIMDLLAKSAVPVLGVWPLMLHEFSGFFVGSLVLWFRPGMKEAFFRTFRRKIPFFLISFEMILMLAAISFYIMALSVGPVSLVSAANSVQALYVFFFAIIATLLIPKYFKEPLERKALGIKLFSILLIMLGVYLIS